MKVICDRAALLDAVNSVVGVVATRTPSPVLQCVKLSATEQGLTLAATDLEIGLRVTVEQVDVEKPGEALIPADKLNQIVRSSDDSTLTLEGEDHTLQIRGADARFSVYGYDPKEAAEVPHFDEDALDCTVDGDTFQQLIRRSRFAAAAEHSRYAINGILIERNDKNLRLIATDGRRLAVARGQAGGGKGDKQCIVPTKALELVNRLLQRDQTADARMAVTENRVQFQIGSGESAAVVTSNLVEGTFPPFEDVIPKDQDRKATFDVDALASAIRRAALLTNEESKGVRLAFSPEQLTLTSRAPEMGEAEIQIEPKAFEGEGLEIGFNPGFITDALKVIDEDEIVIELKAHNKPGVLKIGNDFTYVVMPVNLQ